MAAVGGTPDGRLTWPIPPLVWAFHCQAVSERRSLFLAFLIGFFVRSGIPSLRPDPQYCKSRRAQELSRHHPAATSETRKRILRTITVEIIARVDDNLIDLKIHWQGGDHTQLNVRKARSGEHRWILDATTTDIIRELARQVPDLRIASILNRAGKRTGRENTWNEVRVRAFRSDHGIEVYREGERAERGELNELEAAQVLGTCRMTVHRLIKRGILKPSKHAREPLG